MPNKYLFEIRVGNQTFFYAVASYSESDGFSQIGRTLKQLLEETHKISCKPLVAHLPSFQTICAFENAVMPLRPEEVG